MSAEFKKWEKPVKGSSDEKEIVDLLKTFSSTLRKIPLYPQSHPMVKESILKLFLALDKYTKLFGRISLDIFENNIIFCEEQLDELQAQLKDLIADFNKMSLGGISFSPGIKESEIENFLKILTRKQEVIAEQGGLKNILEKENILNISLNEIRYARVKDGEEITKKENVGSGGFAEGGFEAGKKSDDDIVARVSEFFSGKNEDIPDKEVISYELKKNSRRLVKQLLELIGPEKAVDEILRIIEERFDKAGFSKEEKDIYVEKLKTQVIKLKGPKVTKQQLQKELKMLRDENERLKKRMHGVDSAVKQAVNQATKELAEDNFKIKREKQKINSVLRHVAEGLVIVDNEGKVLLLNPAAEELFGESKEKKIGKHILEGLKEEQMVSLSKDYHSEKEFEIEVAGSDHAKKTLRASTAVIESPDGETIGMVSVLSDITKQKELERMKDAFVSNVTHDLRAPLISIQKSLSLILEAAQDKMPDEQKQFLQIANNNATRLMNLVNDLLDISKLESGKKRLEYQHVPLVSVVDGVFDLLGAWAQSRKIELKKTGLENIEADVDAKLLTQALSNLIGNAVKFTPENGTVTVSAEVVDHKLRLAVSDTGCGIPKDSFERIFEKFEQAKNIPSGKVPKGTGLGLSIVKEIVKLHGGEILVESEIGKGSKFTMVLPKEKEVLDIRD
ncbi:MAG: PAS domain S-box protein [Candidatus Omnitrophica bacterium]|nr:PAS domain S-box protein [Candidatus Omnitrophota bacterium]